MKCISNFFANYDYFGAKQSFRIKNKEDYGTCLGGFCYIFFLIAFTAFLVHTIWSFLSRETFTLMTINKGYTNARPLNLSDNNFSFAMKIEFLNGTTLDNSIYKDLFTTTATIVKKTNHTIKEYIKVPMKKCKRENFLNYADSAIFEKRPLDEMTCFNFHNLVLLGSRLESNSCIFEYAINLNEKYLSDKEKLTKIFSENYFKVTMYYTDTFYDNSSKDKPVYFEMSDKRTFIDLSSFKNVDLYFQQFVFEDDANLLLERYQIQKHIKFENFENNYLTMFNRSDPKVDKRLNLLKMKIRPSNLERTVKRCYKKITELLAGIMAIFMNSLLFLGIFIRMLNNLKARQSIIKRVMKYNDALNDSEETRAILKDLQKDFGHDPKHFDYDNDLNREKIIKKKPTKTDEEVQKDTIKYRPNNNTDDLDDPKQGLLIKDESTENKKPKIPDKTKYTMSLWEFFENIICKNKNKEKKEIYSKAEKKIFYNIDILTYMKKMQELEILKFMLLDDNSLKIMNFISKPGVSYIDRGSKDIYLQTKSSNPFHYDETKLQVEPDYNKELNAIKSVYSEIKNKPNQSECEKKIVDLFEYQVNEITKSKTS